MPQRENGSGIMDWKEEEERAIFAQRRRGVECSSAGVFHSVETFFPLCGKIAPTFSIVWKTWAIADRDT